jgi:hypothetical protein
MEAVCSSVGNNPHYYMVSKPKRLRFEFHLDGHLSVMKFDFLKTVRRKTLKRFLEYPSIRIVLNEMQKKVTCPCSVMSVPFSIFASVHLISQLVEQSPSSESN